MTLENFYKIHDDFFIDLVYRSNFETVNLNGIFFDFDFFIKFCYTSKAMVSMYLKYKDFPNNSNFCQINYLEFNNDECVTVSPDDIPSINYDLKSEIISNEFVSDSFDAAMMNIGSPERYVASKFRGRFPTEFIKEPASEILVIDELSTAKLLKNFLIKKLSTKQISFNDLIEEKYGKRIIPNRTKIIGN